MNRWSLKLPVYFLFFLSGACGLIYQVVWSRMLTHVFGSTVLAVSTVLAAFMSGLALGSYCLGKRGDRISNPLRGFAFCELGIAVSALLLLPLFIHLSPLTVLMTRGLAQFPILHGCARLLFALLLLVVPTTLMGATLPFLCRHLIGRVDSAGHTIALLYGTNALGAIVGALAAGFVLIGHIGTHATVFLAVGLNLVIGAFAWWLSLHCAGGASATTSAKVEAPAPSSYQRRLQHLLMGCFALSGVTSLAYEVLWARALVFYVGNSTYALSTMLAAFLLGIAGGSYLVVVFIERLRRPMLCFGCIQLGIGISASLIMPLLIYLMSLEGVRQALDGSGTAVSRFWSFGISFLLMLVPTALIGMTFPLVGRIVLRSLAHTSADVGRMYAINTLGNIVGALLPAFILLPLLGIQKGVWAMALLNITGGLLILAHGRDRLKPLRLVPGAIVIGFGVWMLVQPFGFRFPARNQTSRDEVLYYREGMAATTMVFRNPASGYSHMSVDGVQIGGTDPIVDYKQQWLAHLPKLLLDDYRTELSVGLGSGILAGESLKHAALEQITCVEIAPSVVQGAALFDKDNNGILESDRARIIRADAVNYLMATRERFDIISTDGKTQPEYSVNGTFFSQDYYELMRSRLAPGGMAIQWIAMDYPPRIFRCVLKTFSSVFPYVQLWQANGNVFLVGSNSELPLDLGRVEYRLREGKQSFDGIRKYGVTSGPELVSHLVCHGSVLRDKLRDVAPNTLVHPVIEFYRAGEFSVDSDQRERENLRLLIEIRDSEAKQASWLRRLSAVATNYQRAERQYLLGKQAILNGRKMEEVEAFFQRALALAPDSRTIRYQIFGHYVETAKYHYARNKQASAEAMLARAVAIWPEDVWACWMLAQSMIDNGGLQQATALLEQVVALNPKHLEARRQLVTIHFNSGNPQRAIGHLRVIITADPKDIESQYRLGFLLGAEGSYAEALQILNKAYQFAPNHPHVIHCLAWVLWHSGQEGRAREVVRKGGDYYRSQPEMERLRNQLME